MPKRPKFEPVETSKGWMVSVPSNMTSGQNRVRRYFQKKSDAVALSRDLRSKYHEGARGGLIPHELAVMAGAAAELLEPYGVTIMDATKAFIATLGSADQTEVFRARYLRCVEDGEAHWSPIYAKDMGKMERWTGIDLMDSKCALVTPQAITEALRSHGAKAQSTLDHRMRYVMAALNFKPRHKKASKIQIMTLKQCAQFIRAGQTPGERRAAAVLLFAGIRPDAEDGEITRLDWEAFGKDEIYIDASISKTKTDRHIPYTPRLCRLIKGHPKSGPVIPPNWRRVYRRMRKAAGLHKEQDITRHTFASNFLAAFGDHSAKQAMGHTEGSSTLFRAYRRAVTEKAGKKYFGVELPQSGVAPDLES